MSHEDEALDVDLHAWHVPEPAAVDAASLVARVLRPVVTPTKRARLRWLAVAIVVVNAAIAALLVIVRSRPDARRPVAIVLPAGGGSAEVEVRELMTRLEQEQRTLEHKIDDIQRLRALVTALSQQLARRAQHTDPPKPDTDNTCDEVSCVLTNYAATCCRKFQRPHAADDLPDALDRAAISNAIAAVRSRVQACGDPSKDKGTVKVHVRVDPSGAVAEVTIVAAPSAALGTCVAVAVRHATFVRTQIGGSFTYPFVF
ncbi:MAG TPA: hypothetical protein VGL61_04010 [Kofleriaceae bacterium]|jgi:hypothetical protein